MNITDRLLGAEDDRLTYHVVYHVGQDSEVHSVYVDTYMGFTTFADILNILAAKHGVRPVDVTVVLAEAKDVTA